MISHYDIKIYVYTAEPERSCLPRVMLKKCIVNARIRTANALLAPCRLWGKHGEDSTQRGMRSSKERHE